MSTPTDPTAGEGLSEVEREELGAGAALFGWAGLDEAHAHLLAAVERIVAAREAAARAEERERIAQAIEQARDRYVPGTRHEVLDDAARIARLAPDTAGESA